ncbi:hypothetical protein O3M35_003222 [Rhynocoris fuscipes]|uniref:Guanylate cyclase domain-containing protein n=1 Tax=Rhynocoris fuscipes TaxID=488301 RepID=A0AAW1CPA4_9HEMI
MVDILYRCGGDLLKFAGDAFIAIWRLCADNYTMGDKADEAINCAIRIQSSLGSFMCDVDVTLKVKISISAGNFIFCLIGDHMTSTYVVYGLPVLEAKKGEGYCSSGDIVISPSVYNCINKTKYYFQKITKGYLKIQKNLKDTHLIMNFLRAGVIFEAQLQ